MLSADDGTIVAAGAPVSSAGPRALTRSGGWFRTWVRLDAIAIAIAAALGTKVTIGRRIDTRTDPEYTYPDCDQGIRGRMSTRVR
jgi:hypothetical protein